MGLDHKKYPFSAALYNKPTKARHRKKKGCMSSLIIVALATLGWLVWMELPVVFG